MADATQVFRADADQFFSTMEKMHASMQKQLDLTEKIHQKSKEGAAAFKDIGKETGDGLLSNLTDASEVMDKLANSASAFVGYFKSAAFDTMKQLLDRADQLAEETRQKNMTVGEAHSQMKADLGITSQAELDESVARINAISRRAGVASVKDGMSVLSKAVAMAGSENKEQGFQATEEALRQFPNDINTATQFALGAVKMNMQNKSISIKDASRAFFAAQDISGLSMEDLTRESTASTLAMNQASGGSISEKTGMSQGIAFHAAFNKFMSDEQGRKTSTAITNMNIEMEKFLKDKGVKATDFDSRMESILADPKLVEAARSGITLEAGAHYAFQNILNKGEAYQLYRRNRTTLDSTPANILDEAIKAKTPEMMALERGKRSEFSKEQGALGYNIGLDLKESETALNILRDENLKMKGWGGAWESELVYNTGLGMRKLGKPQDLIRARLQMAEDYVSASDPNRQFAQVGRVAETSTQMQQLANMREQLSILRAIKERMESRDQKELESLREQNADLLGQATAADAGRNQ